MARSYAISYTGANGGVGYPQLGIGHTVASPTVRPRIFEWEFGSVATPADQASKVQITRWGTAAPTGGSTPTIGVLDSLDPAAIAVPYAACTGGCTMGTIMMMVSINQRATFRWVAAPGKEIVLPALQYNGAGIQIASQSAAYNTECTLFWEE